MDEHIVDNSRVGKSFNNELITVVIVASQTANVVSYSIGWSWGFIWSIIIWARSEYVDAVIPFFTIFMIKLKKLFCFISSILFAYNWLSQYETWKINNLLY